MRIMGASADFLVGWSKSATLQNAKKNNNICLFEKKCKKRTNAI